MTQTAMAKAASQTSVAANATATRQAYYSQKTATSVAKTALATKIGQYKPISRQELVSYAKNHVGEKVYISGRVFNIVSDSYSVQIYMGYSYDALYITMSSALSGLYEDNWITVYGTILGTYCFDNAYGAQICQPQIGDAFYTKP
jgi:hypothetical protein